MMPPTHAPPTHAHHTLTTTVIQAVVRRAGWALVSALLTATPDAAGPDHAAALTDALDFAQHDVDWEVKCTVASELVRWLSAGQEALHRLYAAMSGSARLLHFTGDHDRLVRLRSERSGQTISHSPSLPQY